MIRLIASIDDRQGLTRGGKTPWRIPADFKHFRELTTMAGSAVLMGRKTYEAIGHPLPNRHNIIATTGELQIEGAEVVHDVESFFQSNERDVWVIGGTLYAQALPFAQEIYITHVVGDYDCDKFFPDYREFTLKKEGELQTDNGYKFRHNLYTKM